MVCKFFRFVFGLVMVLVSGYAAGQGADLSTIQKSPELEGKALVTYFERLIDSADFHDNARNLDRALFYCMQAQALEKKLPEENPGRIRLHTQFAITLAKLDALEESIEHLYKAIEIHRKNPDFDPILHYMNHGRLGAFHMGRGKTDSAIAVFKRGVKVAKEMGHSIYIAGSYNNLGIAHQRSGNIDSARKQFEVAMLALKIESEGDSTLLVSIKDNLAQLWAGKGDYMRALRLYRENFEMLTADGKCKYPSGVQAGLGAIRMMLEVEGEEAKGYIDRVVNCLEGLQGYRAVKDWKELSSLRRRYHESRKENKLAQSYALEELKYSDKLLLLSQEKRETILQSLNYYRLASIRQELDLEKLKIKELEDEKSLKNNRADLDRLWWIIFGLSGFVALMSLLLFLRRRRTLNRIKDQVSQLNRES